MLKNIGIRIKLVGGFGIVLALFICVMAIDQYAIKETTGNFAALIETDLGISGHAAQSKALMQTCRKNENNFYLTLDKKYAGEVTANVKAIRKEAEAVIALSKASGDHSIAAGATEFLNHVTAYEENFNRLVAAHEKMGLSPEQGLQKEFGEIVTTFTEFVSYFEIENLHIEMLKLLLHENEFMRTQKKSDQEKVLLSADHFLEELKISQCDVVIREALTDVITEYKKEFRALVSTGDPAHYKAIREITSEMEEMMAAAYIPKARTMALELRNSEKDYLLTREARFVTDTHKAVASLLTAFQGSTLDPDFIEEATTNLTTYKEKFDALVAEDKKIEALKEAMNRAVTQMEPIVDGLSQKADASASGNIVTTTDTANTLAGIALVIGLAAALAGVFLAIVITRGITGPIETMVRSFSRMSKGDFSGTVNLDQKDEIGFMAGALNELTANIRRMFENISAIVASLSRSSEELSFISKGMLEGAETTSAKANTVVSAAEEMSTGSESIAAAMEQAATNMEMVNRSTEELSTTIKEITTSSQTARNTSESAVSQAQSASERMLELNRATKDIGAITETIAEISEQTNLLALNATIEAARAGEAGKGFAVVASEIKALANQTAGATGDIREKIVGIQNITTGTVREIEEVIAVIHDINGKVGEIARAIDEQSQNTMGITDNISQASLGIREVNQQIAQSSMMAGQITHEITEVNLSAEEMTGSSFKVESSSSDLNKLADKLTHMVNAVQL